MTRAWKSGDMAMVVCSDGVERQAVCEDQGGLAWRFHDRVYRRVAGSIARPLVVIDPESRKQIERLRNETLRMLRDHLGKRAVDEMAFTEADLANAMQAALREFANPTPPLPPEAPVWSVVVVADNTPFMRPAPEHLTGGDNHWFGEHPATGERVRLTWAALHELGKVHVVNEGGAA